MERHLVFIYFSCPTSQVLWPIFAAPHLSTDRYFVDFIINKCVFCPSCINPLVIQMKGRLFLRKGNNGSCMGGFGFVKRKRSLVSPTN